MNSSPNRYLVRHASAADAEAAVKVLRASINACVLDHRNNPTILEAWLKNKQPDTFVTWLDNPDTTLWVVLEDNEVRGVGGAWHKGHIMLCYVDPDHQGKGLGRVLLSAIEQELHSRGARELTLESSTTARGFYEQMGYLANGDPVERMTNMRAYPLRKSL